MCLTSVLKNPRFRKGPLVVAVLAEIVIAFVAVTSLVFSQLNTSITVSDVNTPVKIKSYSPLTTPPVKKTTPSFLTPFEECHSIHKQLNSCHTLPNFFLYEKRRSEYKNSIINFWHVEKTGGSTIEQCFMDVYKELGLPETFRGTSECQNLLDILSNEHYFKNATYRPVVRGHNCLSLCEFLHEQVTDRKCSVFTMFRDPYDRVVSHYFFCRQTARTAESNEFYMKSLRLPIVEWAKQAGSVVHRAFVQKWRIFENMDGRKECSKIDDHELNKMMNENEEFMDDVLRNLDKYLSVIGLYEELPTTMEMLQRVYDIPFYENCSTLHEITGNYEGLTGLALDELKRRTKQELMKSEEISELLKFDLKVYARAKELFAAQKLEFLTMETIGKPYKDVS